MKKLICGGMTGITASTLTYPLDLIRTKLSIQVTNIDGTKPSIWWTGKKIVREGGSIFALYKGLPSTLFVSHLLVFSSVFNHIVFQGITPYIGFKMASFDILKTILGVDNSHPNF